MNEDVAIGNGSYAAEQLSHMSEVGQPEAGKASMSRVTRSSNMKKQMNNSRHKIIDNPGVRDELGAAVPDRLKSVFESTRLEQMTGRLKAAQERVERLRVDTIAQRSSCGWLLCGRIKELLLDAEEAFERATGCCLGAKPFCLCPDCGGNGGGCAACKCSGWLTQDAFEKVHGVARHSGQFGTSRIRIPTHTGAVISALLESDSRITIASPNDRLGTPIPPGLREVFACEFINSSAATLNRLLKEVDSLRRATRRNCVLLLWLDFGEITKNLEIARRAIELALSMFVTGAPFCVCSSCCGAGQLESQICQCCIGVAYLPQWRYYELRGK